MTLYIARAVNRDGEIKSMGIVLGESHQEAFERYCEVMDKDDDPFLGDDTLVLIPIESIGGYRVVLEEIKPDIPELEGFFQ